MQAIESTDQKPGDPIDLMPYRPTVNATRRELIGASA